MADAPDHGNPQAAVPLIGQDAAVETFDIALASERVHHAWLLTGPKGVGKATFAYHASHALLTGRDAIDMGADDTTRLRMVEGNEPGITRIARRINEKTGKLRTQIDVEQVRHLRAAMTLSAEAHAWRCVIVDPVEDMNPSAANALLKLLEEPPERVAFFLVTHMPGRLLPTIRSRCRKLDFRPLADADLAEAYALATGTDLPSGIISAARGSVGTAIQLASGDGGSIASGVGAVLKPLPARIDRVALHRLADAASPMDKGDAFATALRVTIDSLASRACEAAMDGTSKQEAALWAQTAMDVQAIADHALGLNLDRRQALLDMFTKIEDAARQAAA